MSTTPTVSVREWTDLVRRARLGKTTKYVALMLATYADYRDGCRIHPGRSRLTWDAEMNFKTVSAAINELVRVGLVEVVRLPHGRDGATEYRLIIGPDLLEHVDVPAPSAARVEIEKAATKRRGAGDVYRPTGRVEPVDNPGRVPPDGTRQADSGHDPAGDVYRPTDPKRGDAYRPTAETCTAGRTPPSTDLSQLLPPNSGEDLRTAVTHTRATGPDQDPISPVMSERCAHGLASRRRADGTPSCALCRRQATGPPDNVVHLRPRTA